MGEIIRTHKFKYISKKELEKLNNLAFMESRQAYINPYILLKYPNDLIPIASAKYRDNKKIARITIKQENLEGDLDVLSEDFAAFPVAEVTIKCHG